MRIIAGTHRGRTILPPQDDTTTRPITDRVKEALFNRLHSLGVLGYGQVLDVFSGTGSMGLEALSRGAAHCTFVEQDRDARQRLEDNLETFTFDDAAFRIVQASAFSPVWSNALADGSITLALLDPPYALTAEMDPLHDLIARLAPKLEPGGVVVLRTPAEVTPAELPGAIPGGVDGPVSFKYGGMALHFYQSPLAEVDEATDPDETAED